MLALLCVAVALQDLPALEEQVRDLHSRDLHDAAAEALRKFGEAHPESAGDDRLKRLREKTRDLAREADLKFTQLLAEAQAHLDAGRPSQALLSAAKARGFYPERRARVDEFQRSVQNRQGSGAMVKVPDAAYWIGSDLPADENPKRQVKVSSFLIDRFPVTNGEYAAYLAATGFPTRSVPKGQEHHPVVMTTWAEAAAYAKWAGKRLLTAEEWEAAARGGDRREYPWGNFFQEKEEVFPANSVEYWQANKHRSPGTLPVDEFLRAGFTSASGAVMGGNVWEWTSTARPGKAGTRELEFRVLKGGSFMTAARAMRCAMAYPENPELAHPDVGFRCAKDAP